MGYLDFARRAIHGWALMGGVLLLGIILVNVLSVIGGVVWRPFPGDFETTQIGVAVAAFAFLPYCQLENANVTADIFTARASERTVGHLRKLAAAIALAFSLILLWCMFQGMMDQRQYGYTTAILSFPVWLAFLPILLSLVLLAIAAVITLLDSDKSTPGGAPP
ncbi:MAG: TRAP transporter small permease [Pseudomonadota bacterium]